MSSGASFASFASGATSVAARATSARAASFCRPCLPMPSMCRMRIEPRLLVLPDERLAQLPGVGRRKVAWIGRVVDGGIEVDEALRRKDAEPARDECGIEPLLRRIASGARAANALSCGDAAFISRSGGIIPVAAERPKRHALRLSTGSQSIVAARPLPAAPTIFWASDRSMPPMRPKRRALSICAEALSASPASEAHIACTNCRIRGSYLRIPLFKRAKRRPRRRWQAAFAPRPAPSSA